jgi:hypothetical protein
MEVEAKQRLPTMVVISIDWVAFLHIISNHLLTQYYTTFNLCGLLTFDPF